MSQTCALQSAKHPKRPACGPAQIAVRAAVITAAPDGTDCTYTTVVADADGPLTTRACAESAELRWVIEDDVAELPLHPGIRG
jgi:8-oxo-dGTP diphosphatase